MATNNAIRAQIKDLIEARYVANAVTCRTYLTYRTGYIDELASPILMVTERQIETPDDFILQPTFSCIQLVRYNTVAEEQAAEEQLSTMMEEILLLLQEKDVQNNQRSFWKGIEQLGSAIPQAVRYSGQNFRQGHIMIQVRK